MVCERDFEEEFFCPTKWQLFLGIKNMLLSGLAWQTDEGTPNPPDQNNLTTMEQFWLSFAAVLEYFHSLGCLLIEEFFCATADQTLDKWRIEYGIPDECDGYDDVCPKVAAYLGSRCEDYVQMAAMRGWTIECMDCASHQNNTPIAGLALADCSAMECVCPPNHIVITLDLKNSPAYTETPPLPVSGLAIADKTNLCGPDIEQFICLIEREKPAHLRVIYEVKNV